MTVNICRSGSPAPLIAYAILPLVRLLTGGEIQLWQTIAFAVFIFPALPQLSIHMLCASGQNTPTESKSHLSGCEALPEKIKGENDHE